MAEKEYIEREAATKGLKEHLNYMLDGTPISQGTKDIYEMAYRHCIDKINSIPATDVREVVTCGECKWWTKQEASLQGRCELSGGYPTAGWFCANGKREES